MSTTMINRNSTKSVAELLGQPPPPTTGRDRLIAAGIELFYREGFQAVGLDRVIEHAGVTKTTFYKHFEAKDDLVLACVRARDEWEMQAWDRAARKLGGDDPRSQLVAFFDVLDVWFNDPEFHGCMFINVASEFSDKRDPIHKAGAEHKRKVRDFFRDLAVKAGATHPDDFADHYTILVDGTLVLRHVHGRDDAAQVARPVVMNLIDTYIPKTNAK
ncbi:MAG: TetR/AcrR family transcriptional regulator [Phycisphaeraceae bacterium]|nr:TetR/AcrR family transcriptional regulator [Phycisphaeraceae bacterium]